MGFFLTFLITAALFIIGELIRPKPNIENAKPADLGDFDFPTATEGRVIPIVWGTVRLNGPNVIWYGDFRQRAIRRRQKTGLFSSKRVTVGFRYFVGIQMALCRGPIDNMHRVWIGDDVVLGGPLNPFGGGSFFVDEPNLFGGTKLGQGGIEARMFLHTGRRDQAASTYLTPFQQVSGSTMAYRGMAYVAPETERMYIGNSTNIATWAFEVNRIPKGDVSDGTATGRTQILDVGLAIVTGDPLSGTDANPVFVLFEILTDLEWGFGIPSTDIDVANFNEAATIVRAEGNGFSMNLDNQREAGDVIQIVEEQIDGVLFQSQLDGRWRINLTRADSTYTDNGFTVPDLLPTIDGSNVLEIRTFSRPSWDDTTNFVDVEYVDRRGNYVTKYGKAQDMANVQLQRGAKVTTSIRMPGVKTAPAANDIAWRELRVLAFPLAKLEVVTDRTFFAAEPGRVALFTDTDLGLTDVRMRVVNVDLGELASGRISMTLVEDVFRYDDGSFGNPPTSGWTPPTDTLSPFAAGTFHIFEAPRGIVAREEFSTTEDDKIWCGARNPGAAAAFNLLTRSGPSSPPGGDFEDAGEAFEFLLLGQLSASLDVGSAYPLATLDITTVGAGLDSAADVVAAFSEATVTDIGLSLINLVLLGNSPTTREFILVESATDQGGGVVRLSGVYRGVMDTPQRSHAINTQVSLLFNGGSLTEPIYNPDDFVQVKLQPISTSDEVDESAIPAFELQMDNRVRRPYPPSELTLNGTRFPTTTVSLDSGAGVPDTRGIATGILRRDFRVGNEIDQLGTDAGNLFSDYPTANTTTHRMNVINDPDGTATTILTGVDFAAGQSATILRTAVLAQTGGAIPSRLRVVIIAQHTVEAVQYDSRNNLIFDFDVSSTQLAGLFNLGVLPIDTASAAYTAPVDGIYPLAIDTALPGGGSVEARINGGVWTQIIGAAGTSGNISGVLTNDTIEIRHVSTTGSTEQLIRLSTPAPALSAYGILTN